MVAGILVSSVVCSLAGLTVSVLSAETLLVVIGSYLLWGTTGAVAFILASVTTAAHGA